MLNMACVVGLSADVVTMTGGNERLTGTFKLIEGGGVCEFQSVLSSKTLRLRSAMVGKVEFPTEVLASDSAPARLVLVNGDVIPCGIVAMDKAGLVAESAEFGKIRIERRHLASLQFGLRQNKLLYSTSRGLDGWLVDRDDPDAWRFESGALTAMGKSVASRSVSFPEQFILKFELEWGKNSMPDIMMLFGDPLIAQDQRCDRYCLTFQSTGFEIKREAATNRRFTTIAFVNRMPTQCEGRRLLVELQVDRRDASMRLLLDGKFEGEFFDPVPSPPSGDGLVLVSQVYGVVQKVSGLEVLQWDDMPRKHRDELRENSGRDSLITLRNERWSGVIEGTASSEKGEVLRFRSGFGDQSVEVPLADVSMVYFSQPLATDGVEKEPSAPYVLSYAGGGRMRIASCRFSNDLANIQHSLLGLLQMRRNMLRTIERVAPTDAKPPGE